MHANSYLYCPYCGFHLETTTHPVSYGNPIKTCPQCSTRYIDPFCSEPALRPYKPLSAPRQLWSALGDGFLLAVIAAVIAEFACGSTTTALTVAGVVFPVGSVLCFLRHLSTHKKTEARRLARWQESDKRLRDPKYAAALKLNGYHVPPQYLPSGYWQDRETLTYRRVTVKDSFGTKKNPPLHMPSSSEHY